MRKCSSDVEGGEKGRGREKVKRAAEGEGPSPLSLLAQNSWKQIREEFFFGQLSCAVRQNPSEIPPDVFRFWREEFDEKHGARIDHGTSLRNETGIL
jgi:hypothetical protein